MATYLRTAIEDAMEASGEAFGLGVATLEGTTPPAAPAAPTIEGYRSDAPTGCLTAEQPGARALLDLLRSRFRGRGSCVPVCRPVRGHTTGYSLHAEGRAIDWYLSANDPVEAAEAQRILDWLLAADAQGNQHALARRMGIQELIWNRRIWSARRHAEGWRAYGGVSPHTDHIHIGMTWPGARGQTSHWRGGTGTVTPPAPPAPPVAPKAGAQEAGLVGATALGATTAMGRYWEGVLRFGLAGNTVKYLIDGPEAFRSIKQAIDTATSREHYVYLLGWWCDPWINLAGPGTSLLDLFGRAGQAGVQVRVLVWEPSSLVYPEHARLHTAGCAAINRIPNCHAQQDAGGSGLSVKSHHQKLVVVKGNEGLIAFCGGVDINADRVHDLPPPATAHRADRPRIGWVGASGGSGSGAGDEGAPLHDVHVRMTGPTTIPFLRMFLRRWYARSGSRTIDTTAPLRGTWSEPVPRPTGTQYARGGETFMGELREPGRPRVTSRERTVQDIWVRSLLAARRFIYMEEQYMISICAAEAIRRVIDRLDHVTILIPPSELADLPGKWGRRRAFINHITGGRPNPKLRIYTRIAGPPQNCNRTRGLHIYVHSKMAVIDDELMIVGSANCNNRGWETDSELVVASFEDLAPGAVTQASSLRRALWAEHLGQPASAVADPIASKGLWDSSPTRQVCRYNPTGGSDPLIQPSNIDAIADPSDRQSGDPCCTLLRQC